MKFSVTHRRSWGVLIGLLIASFPLAGRAANLASSDVDAVRKRIAECWYVDPNATFAKDIAVQVRTTLSPDGSVLTAEVVDKTRAANDANYRKFAQAAV